MWLTYWINKVFLRKLLCLYIFWLLRHLLWKCQISFEHARTSLIATLLYIKINFFIKDFFRRCDKTRRLRIWSHLLKKNFMITFIFCTVLFDFLKNSLKYCHPTDMCLTLAQYNRKYLFWKNDFPFFKFHNLGIFLSTS